MVVAVPSFYSTACYCSCSGCSCYGNGYAVAPAPAAPVARGAETVPVAPRVGGMPPAGDGAVTPRSEAERDAVRRLLKELRQGGKKEEETSRAAPARVTVRLPADARLWVDQVECPLTSGERSFDTPELAPGQTYYYTLKMQVQRRGAPMTDSQRVLVSAGQRVTVSFANPEPVTTAQR